MMHIFRLEMTTMKAWQVRGKDEDCGSYIVFADTRNEARKKAQFTQACENDKYIDIIAKRLPMLDDMEDYKPKSNPWLNDEIRTILVRDYGWSCLEPVYADCETCCVREYCRWG